MLLSPDLPAARGARCSSRSTLAATWPPRGSGRSVRKTRSARHARSGGSERIGGAIPPGGAASSLWRQSRGRHTNVSEPGNPPSRQSGPRARGAGLQGQVALSEASADRGSGAGAAPACRPQHEGPQGRRRRRAVPSCDSPLPRLFSRIRPRTGSGGSETRFALRWEPAACPPGGPASVRHSRGNCGRRPVDRRLRGL